MLIIVIITCAILGTIFLQDLTSRSIWWFLPPVLFGLFVLYRWGQLSWADTGFNLAFIVFLMAFLTLYIRLRFGKLQNPFKEHFGLGDLLFILALTPLLGFREFVFFFTVGTFLTLVLFGISSLFKKQQTVPYAGYFSLVTMAYLVLSYNGTNVFQLIQP